MSDVTGGGDTVVIKGMPLICRHCGGGSFARADAGLTGTRAFACEACGMVHLFLGTVEPLARMSHTSPAAASHLAAPAALRSVGVLDDLVQVASARLGRKPCCHHHLRRLATEGCETCELGSADRCRLTAG